MISILKDCNKRIIALVCPLKSSGFCEMAQPDKVHSRAIDYYYYPYRAFGGQNKIVYSTRFVTRRAILLILSGQYY